MFEVGVLMAAGCASAGLSGFCGALALRQRMEESRRRQSVKRTVSSARARRAVLCGGLAALVLGVAIRESSAPASAGGMRGAFLAGSRKYLLKARLAGMKSMVTLEGLCQARLLACVVAASALSVLGFVASPQLAAIGAVAGLAVGWMAVPWALGQEATARKQALERHLSEAIEVICLGLRSGLSFDYALRLYCDCFESALAHELALAHAEWQAGLRSREEVLRDVASTYDSAIFSRVVDNIVRAMRFGSPLAESLEVLAVEARQSHKAYVEEKVMKAPVKMMLPVGTLILPSMLILVLGPVLLDLMQGF